MMGNLPDSSSSDAAVIGSESSPGGAPGDTGSGPAASRRPVEIGGRKGPEPTRFGDWEKNGRCIDF